MLFLIATSISSASVFGQFINMPTTIKTPYGNVRISTPAYMPHFHYHNWRNAKTTDTYNIRIVYKNDSVAKVLGRIVTSDSLCVIAIDSTLTITPRETKEISCSLTNFKKAKGLPTDSSWLFQLTTGSIKVYSNVPFNEEPVVAMQKDDGVMMPFSQEVLTGWIGVSDKIMDLIEKHKYVMAIRYYKAEAAQ